MNAYDKIYLDEAQDNLGWMFDYAVNGLGYKADEFFTYFITSRVAEQFARGNCRFVAGMSGVDLAAETLRRIGLPVKETKSYFRSSLSPEYWAGWALAYLQWEKAWNFKYIQQHGLAFGDIVAMYNPLHEADISKFVSVAENRIKAFSEKSRSPLKTLRKSAGITQEDLSRRSGVSLRMIRAYEQKDQDIRRAEFATVIALSSSLNCPLEALIP